MKTIQERTAKYGNMMYERHPDNDDFLRGCETGYEDGATEQKKIDIEKACTWLLENVIPYTGFDFGTFEEEFYKAMEE